MKSKYRGIFTFVVSTEVLHRSVIQVQQLPNLVFSKEFVRHLNKIFRMWFVSGRLSLKGRTVTEFTPRVENT